MAKKKVAKKSGAVRKAAKQAPPKPALVVEPEPTPVVLAAPPKSKVATTTVSEAKVEAKAPARDPRFPDAKGVATEYETKTHHIFKLKDHSKVCVTK